MQTDQPNTLPALSSARHRCDHVGDRQHVWTSAFRGPTPTMPAQRPAGTCGQETRAQLHLLPMQHRAQLKDPLLNRRRAVVKTSRSGCRRCSGTGSRHPHGAGHNVISAFVVSTMSAVDLDCFLPSRLT